MFWQNPDIRNGTSPADSRPLVAALPGQFIILRIQPEPDSPVLLRNYSLSDLPSADRYRISVKLEQNGAASTYLHQQIRVGDLLEVAAPRGNFTLRPGAKPAVLLSAGVGATPVLAMLHSLAREISPRQVWWVFGARNGEDHPFAEESRNLVKALPRGKSFIAYSRPGSRDRPMLQDVSRSKPSKNSVCGAMPISTCAGPLGSCRI
jgi:ferredoxin-NADP reductase